MISAISVKDRLKSLFITEWTPEFVLLYKYTGVFLLFKSDKRNKDTKVRLKNADEIQKFGWKTQLELDFLIKKCYADIRNEVFIWNEKL